MDTPSPTETIATLCNRLSVEITSLHRAAGGLPDGGPRGEILKALFELTRQVEIVKKQAKRLASSGEKDSGALV